MTISLDWMQDAGPLVGGVPQVRVPVANIGHKDAPLDETHNYVFYPLQRPSSRSVFSHSFLQYNYTRLSGTYIKASRVAFKITNNCDGAAPEEFHGAASNGSPAGVRLFYTLSSTYSPSTNVFDGEMIFIPNGKTIVVYPMLSTQGPQQATSYIKHLTSNTTYYTQYLVTQVFCESGYPYGNIGDVTVEVMCDEYESTDI